MDWDPADKEALQRLFDKLDVDDLNLIQKYLNRRANARTKAALDDVERLIGDAFGKVRKHKGLA